MVLIDNDPKQFTAAQINGYDVSIRKDFPQNTIPLPIPDSCKQVTSSKYAEVYKLQINNDTDSVSCLYIKKFLPRSKWDSIKDMFRGTRASRAAQGAIILYENGFNSPRLIALDNNILITEELPNARSIYDWEKDWSNPASCPVDKKREFVRQLGQTIGKLHAKNISHGDLRPGNIYAGFSDDQWSFYFLDNERTRKLWSLSMKLRIKNLVQINILARYPFTYTDRLRFFKEYLKQNPSLTPSAKTLRKEIAQRTKQRMKKIFAQKTEQI